MRDAISAMQGHLGIDQVGLVMRWNKRPDLIWTIYSERMNEPDALNIPPDKRQHIDRRNGDANEDNEIFTPSSSVVYQIGCHAEEIMIANWTYFELETAALILAEGLARQDPSSDGPVVTEKFKLTEVDLVLSKSPCHGPGGSQPLVCGVHVYGTGCAMKLYQFCSLDRFSAVQFRIFYCALPPEKMETRLVPRDPPAPTGDKGKDKKAQKQFEQSEKQRISAIEKNITPKLTDPKNIVGPNELMVRSNLGKLIGQGLRGIGKLNQLRNVTCEPLQ